MNIYVKKEDVEEAISILDKNKNILIINNNCFDTSKIITLLNLEENCNMFYDESIFFKFSYNDGIINELIKISCECNSDRYDLFVKESKIIDDNILDKLIDNVSNKYPMYFKNIDIESLSHSYKWKKKKYNEFLEIEVLSYLSSNNIKNDLKNEYESFTKRITEQNNSIKNVMIDLYSKILKMKIYEN